MYSSCWRDHDAQFKYSFKILNPLEVEISIKSYASSNFRVKTVKNCKIPGRDLKKKSYQIKNTFLWSVVVVGTLWTVNKMIFGYFHYNIPPHSSMPHWMSLDFINEIIFLKNRGFFSFLNVDFLKFNPY